MMARMYMKSTTFCAFSGVSVTPCFSSRAMACWAVTFLFSGCISMVLLLKHNNHVMILWVMRHVGINHYGFIFTFDERNQLLCLQCHIEIHSEENRNL